MSLGCSVRSRELRVFKTKLRAEIGNVGFYRFGQLRSSGDKDLEFAVLNQFRIPVVIKYQKYHRLKVKIQSKAEETSSPRDFSLFKTHGT